MKFIKSFLFITLFTCLLCSCNSKLSGRYEGISNRGIPVYFEFDGNKVTTATRGNPLTGTYKVDNNIVTLTFVLTGHTQDFRGELKDGKLYFQDVVLEKKRQ